MEREKKRLRNGRSKSLLLWLGIIVSLLAAAYPLLSNEYYERHQSSVAAAYERLATDISETALKGEWEACRQYNERLQTRGKTVALRQTGTASTQEEYDKRLNLNGDGMMGYLHIPTLSLRLPVYHGCDEAVLSRGLGHMPQTNLPVGGSGTHAAITGHTGTAQRRLFTDLESLGVGDTFSFHVMGEVLRYRVDRILRVLPGDVSGLTAEPEKDYMTLITCTPYGINSHRLLVRGSRIQETSAGDMTTGLLSAGGGIIPLQAHEACEHSLNLKSCSRWLTAYLSSCLSGGALYFVILAAGLWWQEEGRREGKIRRRGRSRRRCRAAWHGDRWLPVKAIVRKRTGGYC